MAIHKKTFLYFVMLSTGLLLLAFNTAAASKIPLSTSVISAFGFFLVMLTLGLFFFHYITSSTDETSDSHVSQTPPKQQTIPRLYYKQEVKQVKPSHVPSVPQSSAQNAQSIFDVDEETVDSPNKNLQMSDQSPFITNLPDKQKIFNNIAQIQKQIEAHISYNRLHALRSFHYSWLLIATTALLVIVASAPVSALDTATWSAIINPFLLMALFTLIPALIFRKMHRVFTLRNKLLVRELIQLDMKKKKLKTVSKSEKKGRHVIQQIIRSFHPKQQALIL